MHAYTTNTKNNKFIKKYIYKNKTEMLMALQPC